MDHFNCCLIKQCAEKCVNNLISTIYIVYIHFQKSTKCMRPHLTFNQISKQIGNDKTCREDKCLWSRPITLTNSDRPERMIPSDTIGQMTCPSARLVSTFPAQ